jgi:hypothetical protein
VFAELNALGISDSEVWEMTEKEVNGKLWERRIRRLNEALDSYVSYGDAGIKELYKLLPTNPLIRLYEKRQKAKAKQEEAYDLDMLKRTKAMLEALDKKPKE